MEIDGIKFCNSFFCFFLEGEGNLVEQTMEIDRIEICSSSVFFYFYFGLVGGIFKPKSLRIIFSIHPF